MATPTVSAASAPGAGAPTPAIFAAPGAAAGAVQAGKPPPQAPPQAQLPPAPVPRRLQLQYAGVRQLPGGGGWAAQVLVDPERRVSRTLGPFPDPHAAALAHDRVAIAYLGDSARANFRPGFHPVEQRFLRLCRTKEAEIDVCALVADAATYEARYAAFLRAVLALERRGEYMGVVLDFFIDRAAEIGREALEEGGKKLEERFVEMHRNKAVDPRWRAWYLDKVAQQRQQMEMKRQQQQKRHGEGGGSGCASTVQQHQHQQTVQSQHRQQQQQTVQPQQLHFPDVKREN